MQVDWETIEEFPEYAVSETGEVANMKRGGMNVRPRPNQYGLIRVGLMREGRQQTKSVALLVAEAFVPGRTDTFDTPIHLDGDRTNCSAENLMWRPRWFAIKYHKQFMVDTFHNWTVDLLELETQTTYKSVKEACIRNGLYYQDVIKSFIEETFVFPTWQEFRRLTD